VGSLAICAAIAACICAAWAFIAAKVSSENSTYAFFEWSMESVRLWSPSCSTAMSCPSSFPLLESSRRLPFIWSVVVRAAPEVVPSKVRVTSASAVEAAKAAVRSAVRSMSNSSGKGRQAGRRHRGAL